MMNIISDWKNYQKMWLDKSLKLRFKRSCEYCQVKVGIAENSRVILSERKEKNMIDDKSRKSFNAAVWYIISNFISKALLYVCTPLYTRLLTTSEYGEYSNFLSYQNILVTLATLELGASIAIAYYDYEDDKEFDGFVNTISIFSYLIPSFFCTIIFIFNDYFSKLFSIKFKYLIILLVYITLNNTINIFQAEQRVRLKYKLSVAVTLGTSIFTVVFTLIFAFAFQDTLQSILLGGVFVNVIVSSILAFKLWLRNNAIKWDYLKYALRVAVPLVPHTLAGSILGSSDKIMIMKYCGGEMTALYSLVYTISMIITMIASSINKAWTPWFFDRLKNNKMDQIKNVSNVIVLIMAIFSFVMCLLAPEILWVMGGSAYASSSVLMPPVISACFCNCISTFYINIEFYNKKTAGISIATVISAFLNVLLNYIFIRKFGYIMAAYTTLISSGITLLFHLFKVSRQGMWRVFDNKFFLTTMIICLILSLGLLPCYNNYIMRYIILGGCIVGMFIIALNYKEQIRFLINNLKNDKKLGRG